MMKVMVSRLAEALEDASRSLLEAPFAHREACVEDLIREMVSQMESEKIELLDGVYVPDHYTLYLSTALFKRYQNYLGDRLCEHLAAEVQRQVDRWDYELLQPVEVVLADGRHDDHRRVAIACRFRDEESAREEKYRPLDSDDPIAHFRRARQLQAEGRMDAAIQEFEATLAIEPNLATAYFNLGALYFKCHRYQEAALNYEQGLEIEPQQMAAHADVAKAYEMLGEWDHAQVHLETAAALRPGHPVIQRRLARVREERRWYGMLREKVATAFVRPETGTRSERIRLRHFYLFCDQAFPEDKRAALERMLEAIHTELCGVFQTYPEERVEVHLSQTPQRGYCPTPAWAAALYDGRIHLVWDASRPIELTLAYVLLRHEFTHVLLEQLAGRHAPAWLTEGLAELHARRLMDTESQMLRQAVHQNRTIPLSQMERGFHRLPENRIRLAYVEAYSMAEYLMERFGMPRLLELLQTLGKRTPWTKAAREILGCSHDSLEKQWLDSVRRQRP